MDKWNMDVLYGRAIKRQASLRELEMKMVRTKTKRTMHPFDLSFYPAPSLSLIPPISTQHITDKGTVEIALTAPLFLSAGSSLSQQLARNGPLEPSRPPLSFYSRELGNTPRKLMITLTQLGVLLQV